MALVVGTNSYVTAAESETYAVERDGTEDFVNLFEEEKEQLLVSATDFLDTLVWVGEAASDAQVLAWPRNADYYDPRLGAVVTISAETPIEINEAQIELAMFFATNGSLTGSSGSTSGAIPDSIKVGSIELDGLKAKNESFSAKTKVTIGGAEMPTMVANLIGPLLSTATSASGLFKPYFRAW